MSTVWKKYLHLTPILVDFSFLLLSNIKQKVIDGYIQFSQLQKLLNAG